MKKTPKNLSESFLFHIWDGGHLQLDRLKTRDGRRIELIFRGRWNMDTGPDFIGALIKMDGELYKGDVEIHVFERDWFQHQHQSDPRYNEVILHAVLIGQENTPPCITAAGKPVPTLILRDFFDESVSRLQARVEDLPEHLPTDLPENCLLRAKPAPKIGAILDYWGLERLRLKKERFREERDYFQFNELIYQGFCEALGYEKNRQPFLKLSLLLPLEQIWQAIVHDREEEALLRLQGIFLGAAGLLPQNGEENRALPRDVQQYWQRLKFYWHQFQETYPVTPSAATKWQFFRLRPLNFPTVRLAGLCRLLLAHRTTGFLEPILGIFRDLRYYPEKIFSQLQHQLLVNSYGFWRAHFRLDEAETSFTLKDYKLIGAGKTKELIVNVVLPVLMVYTEEADDLELQVLIKQVYLCAPSLDSNQLLRNMNIRLGLDQKAGPLTACQQQGLLHLAKSLCPRWYCQECIQAGV